MIERLHLQNFKSHKESDIHFSPGINLITGESDNGKSALLYGLYWITDNKPLGSEFCSWDTKETIAEVVVDGKNISRVRKGSNSFYQIGEEIYKIYKNKVPEEVLDILNLGDINWKLPHAPHFLFSNSAGDVAKYLNKFVDLEVIDSTLKHANSRIKSTKNTLEWGHQNKEKFEEELSTYSKLNALDVELTQLEKEEETLQVYQDQYSKLLDVKEELESLHSLIEIDTKITQLGRMISSLEKDSDSLSNLEVCIQRLNTLFLQLQEETRLLEIGESVPKLCTFVDSVQKMQEEKTRMSSSICELEELYSTARQAQEEYNALKRKCSGYEKEFSSSFPAICPFCGK